MPESEASVYERLLGESHTKHEEELALTADELTRTTGTPAEIRLAQGDGATAMLNACEEDLATLVAMGARGRGPIRKALLGGVSTKVLRAASGPVLVHAAPPGVAASGSAGMVDRETRG
jgi:nucleotide-binding universal stress UspA family protein